MLSLRCLWDIQPTWNSSFLDETWLLKQLFKLGHSCSSITKIPYLEDVFFTVIFANGSFISNRKTTLTSHACCKHKGLSTTNTYYVYTIRHLRNIRLQLSFKLYGAGSAMWFQSNKWERWISKKEVVFLRLYIYYVTVTCLKWIKVLECYYIQSVCLTYFLVLYCERIYII